MNVGGLPVRRREIVGFCAFDFANSSYTTLITTLGYALYFKEVVVGDADNGDFLWSLAKASAMVLLILTSPILGALADHSGRKKLFLLGTTLQTVVACALLYFVGPGAVALGILLYVIGTVGFEGGYVFYNAFLPEISTPKTMGQISGWSWGTGFVGGLLALVACFPILSRPTPEWGPAFLVVAAFFAIFAIPTFLFLRERGERRPMGSPLAVVRIGFARLAETFANVRRYRDVGRYVSAAFFFYGSIQTVIAFAAIYAKDTLAMGNVELVQLLIVSNLVAVPGTLLAGYLADWIGTKRALIVTLLGWFALLVFGSQITNKTLFWVMAMGVAVGMGSTQAIARAMMAELSPPEKESEFFGFYILAGQLGAVVTLLLFGITASFFGGQRWAVLLTAPSFLIATALVARVRR